MANVEKVDEIADVRRARRALSEDELSRLLEVVEERHQLAYRVILATVLRRHELRQLQWGDVKLNAPMPFIQLRANTTKASRGDTLPIRAELAERLRKAKGDAANDERVCQSISSMDTHKRYLDKAGIAYVDEAGRRADFHALRHTYGTLLSKSGVAPRVAMCLMRYKDIKLTMNCYTDPRIFDLAGAVERLPALPGGDAEVQAAKATGTDDKPVQQDGKQVANRVAIATLDRQSVAANDNAHEDDRQSQPLEMAAIGNKKPHPAGMGKRAGDGARTHDIHVGNVTLYH